MKPFVSIIVPLFRDEKTIAETLDSLNHLDYPDFEVIFVLDKDSDDGSEKLIQRNMGKRMKLFRNTKHGSAANRNFGVSKASKKAKYFGFTDSDCIVKKDWLKHLVEEMEQQDKEVGCVGGINLVPSKDNGFAHLVGALENTTLGGGGSSQGTLFREKIFVPSIPNCNGLYRKELWLNNKQDENLIVGQDGEFNYRLQKKGSRFLVTPDAVVYHHRTSNLKGFVKRMYNYGIATAKIFKMHPEILRIRWYALVSVFALVTAVVIIILSFFNSLIFKIFVLLLLIYIVILAMTTVEVYYKSKLKNSLLTMILIPIQHLMYAVGFLKEIIAKT